MMNKITFKLKEIEQTAQQVLKSYEKYKVWFLCGEMGAGKTTFLSAVCKYLQVDDKVQSPTYSIMNEYDSSVCGKIYHLDLFRLNSIEEFLSLGVEEILGGNNYCFIEWADMLIEQGFVADSLVFHFSKIDDISREIAISELKKTNSR